MGKKSKMRSNQKKPLSVTEMHCGQRVERKCLSYFAWLLISAQHLETVTHFLARIQPQFQTISSHYRPASLPTSLVQLSGIRNYSLIACYEGIKTIGNIIYTLYATAEKQGSDRSTSNCLNAFENRSFMIIFILNIKSKQEFK